MPMTSALRDARDAHGWTLAQAAARLIKLAESRGAPISASHASLRQMISDMERGRRKPGHYKPLLCDLFGRTPDELGFADEEPTTTSLPAADLREMLTRASAVTPSAIADLQRQVDGLRTLDRQLGSPAVVEPTRQLVQTMQELMAHVFAGGTREALAVVLSDAAALNAWQVLNTGDVRRAWELHNIARTAGLESGRPDLLAHAMGEQTYGLIDIDRPQDAVHLAEAAREVAGNRVSPLLVAWLHAAAAEAYAAAGDASSCRSALNAASRALPRDTDNTATPYLSLDEWHLERWRGNVLAKLGESSALDSLMVALERTPSTYVRATASLHCDIAQSLGARGDRPGALRHAQQARTLARQTGSIRQLRRVEAVMKRMA
jgi:transcriptional regulator with XRE-family HTH domain